MDDRNLRDDVVEELDFDPRVTATNIGVSVKNGIVTLSGHVASYAEKDAAERCAQRVRGVKGIAEELAVRYAYDKQTGDDQIAQRVLSVISWDAQIPKDAIKVKVEHGVVTLTGTVDWHFQKEAADKLVRKLSGVVALANDIAIKTHTNATEVKAKIMAAFKRDAELEGHAIRVHVDQDKVRLEGSVKAWRERQVAKQAAWSVPGVKAVEDKLTLA